MFILSDEACGSHITNINKIVITFFSSKSNILHIYDTQFIYDANIIPLITSLLEVSPQIYNYKQYKCIDTNIIIKKQNTQHIINNNMNNDIHNNNNINPQYSYPSFYYDIDVFNSKYLTNMNNINNVKSTLINTIIDNEGLQLIRMYNNIKITNDFTQSILCETEYKAISWDFDWGNFEMLIKLNTSNNTSNTTSNNTSNNTSNTTNNNNILKVIYQLNINIIEDNKIITSRLTNINNIINKIHKLKTII